MSSIEIVSLVVTIVCLISFSLVFTFLFRHYYKTNISEVKEGKKDFELIDNAVIDESEKHSKSKRFTKILSKIFSYLLLGVVAFAFGMSLYSRITGSLVSFNGNSLIVIATGSMSERNKYNSYLYDSSLTSTYTLDNQFNTYDVIGISEYKNGEEPKLYDVVAFKGKNDVTYVHRIIEINDSGYVTRGDSNAVSDTNSLYDNYLTRDKILGYYNGTRIQVLGVFVIFLQSNSGIVTIVSIIYCMIMFDFYKNKLDDVTEARTKELLSLLEYSLDTDIEAEKKMSKTYKEVLYYQNHKYVFIDGKFAEKVELNDDEAKEFNSKLLSVASLNNKDDKEATIKVKNIDTGEVSEVKEAKDNVFSKIKELLKLNKKEEVSGEIKTEATPNESLCKSKVEESNESSIETKDESKESNESNESTLKDEKEVEEVKDETNKQKN